MSFRSSSISIQVVIQLVGLKIEFSKVGLSSTKIFGEHYYSVFIRARRTEHYGKRSRAADVHDHLEESSSVLRRVCTGEGGSLNLNFLTCAFITEMSMKRVTMQSKVNSKHSAHCYIKKL